MCLLPAQRADSNDRSASHAPASRRGERDLLLMRVQPIPAGEHSTQRPFRGRANMSSGPGSVLVVEDEPSVRALMQDVLAGEGYRVLDANDPWEALGVAETCPINLLVTDVLMPDMNGPELAKRIESIRPETKVIFMSASNIDVLLDPCS